MKDATDNKTSSLNDFQMEWNRRYMEENERVRQNPPSLEYLKAQSKRLAEQVKAAFCEAD